MTARSTSSLSLRVRVAFITIAFCLLLVITPSLNADLTVQAGTSDLQLRVSSTTSTINLKFKPYSGWSESLPDSPSIFPVTSGIMPPRRHTRLNVGLGVALTYTQKYLQRTWAKVMDTRRMAAPRVRSSAASRFHT
ncbi:hypothetical protein EV424DRAFT_574190 [Suillus variegatus]|nr:hypothetical protein EV424DRAFT_574190 [Suillus variegatus]